MKYPMERWYVVAAGDDIGSAPLARTVCGEPLVLYRTTEGTPVAMNDRCPHRGFPLSAGSLCGDEIQCGYHGLRFGPDGSCTFAPGQDRIPSRADVCDPTVGGDGAVGVGLDGRPRRRRPRAITGDAVVRGSQDGPRPRHGAARRPLRTARRQPARPVARDLPARRLDRHTGGRRESDHDDRRRWTRGVVHVSRHMESVECPAFYTGSTGLASPIDRWQDIEYHAPGCYILHVRVAPHGSVPDGETDDRDAAHLEVLYAITPIDEHRTMDFWAVCRDFGVDDPELDRFIAEIQSRGRPPGRRRVEPDRRATRGRLRSAGGQPQDRHGRTRCPPCDRGNDRVQNSSRATPEVLT